ncbi:hypothetical protein FOL47_006427 [Perkinsus chesapeaki]|uniref:Dynein light chain 1, cytoplasmic n=1 Tax=Perkinsus chesapeaki TaxID=330153 RepID=A0A7J6LS23_PERCH|nr:hypothetical protein FOL47_006427 [Perkinsus chesapeaki]
MPEGKNIVSDMDENSEMRTDAIAQASIAIQKYETEYEMAKHIKAFFDGKYNPNWMCVVGKDFASFGTYETKTYLFFYVGQIAVRQAYQRGSKLKRRSSESALKTTNFLDDTPEPPTAEKQVKGAGRRKSEPPPWGIHPQTGLPLIPVKDWPEHLKPLPLHPSRKFEMETPYCGLGTDALSGMSDSALAMLVLDLPTKSYHNSADHPLKPPQEQSATARSTGPLSASQLADPHANCIIQERELLQGVCVTLDGDRLVLRHLVDQALNDRDVVIAGRFGTGRLRPGAFPLKPMYTPMNAEDNTLIFESRFESGNLQTAVKVTMGKPSSLFQKGMEPVVWSTQDFYQGSGVGWVRGSGVCGIQYGKTNTDRHLLTRVAAALKVGEECDGVPAVEIARQTASFVEASALTFQYTPQWDGDTVYFAYTYPYTLTRLHDFISEMENSRGGRRYLTRYPLCRTLAGNRVDVLTITSSRDENAEADPEEMPTPTRKQYVAITARVHPGESVSSFACEGLIRELLSDTALAKKLRANYIFKIVPMLNPDGVVLGNYRANLSGRDLNRVWNQPCKFLHPTIYFTKRLLCRCAPLALFADLHGHSRKLNWFSYGCLPPRKPRRRGGVPPFTPPPDMRTRDAVLLPLLLAKLSPTFSLKDCFFHMQPQKESTARITIYKELTLPKCMTVEISFCGSSERQFAIKDYLNIGKEIAMALAEMIDSSTELPDGITELTIKKYIKQAESAAANDAGSDSDPEADLKRPPAGPLVKGPSAAAQAAGIKSSRVEAQDNGNKDSTVARGLGLTNTSRSSSQRVIRPSLKTSTVAFGPSNDPSDKPFESLTALRRSRSAVSRGAVAGDDSLKLPRGLSGEPSVASLTTVELGQETFSFGENRTVGHRSDRALMFAQAPKLALLSGNTCVVRSHPQGTGGLMLLPSAASTPLRFPAAATGRRSRPGPKQYDDRGSVVNAAFGRSVITRLPRLKEIVRGKDDKEGRKFTNLSQVMQAGSGPSLIPRVDDDDEATLLVPPASPANK